MNKDIFLESISDAVVSCQRKELRPSRGIFQADVYLLNIGDQSVVVKDFSRRPWWSRVFVCRYLIGREIKVLTHFDPSGFVPQFYGRISSDIFAMEFLEGEHPGVANAGKWSGSYEQAKAFLSMFHREGYVHNDFRRNNVLIQPDGSVRFIDFAAAMMKPERCHWWLLPWCRLLNVMKRADITNLRKMKPGFTGERLSDAERNKLKKPMWVRLIQYAWSNGINKPILRRFK